ncbi:MAG: dimethylargininase [Polaribacter sp.]|jgi:dimethylargininase
MFTKAIVRTPCKAMIEDITTADLGKPNYKNALKQHQYYICRARWSDQLETTR